MRALVIVCSNCSKLLIISYLPLIFHVILLLFKTLFLCCLESSSHAQGDSPPSMLQTK